MTAIIQDQTPGLTAFVLFLQEKKTISMRDILDRFGFTKQRASQLVKIAKKKGWARVVQGPRPIRLEFVEYKPDPPRENKSNCKPKPHCAMGRRLVERARQLGAQPKPLRKCDLVDLWGVAHLSVTKSLRIMLALGWVDVECNRWRLAVAPDLLQPLTLEEFKRLQEQAHEPTIAAKAKVVTQPNGREERRQRKAEQRARVREMLAQHPVKEVARLMGLPYSTVNQIARREFGVPPKSGLHRRGGGAFKAGSRKLAARERDLREAFGVQPFTAEQARHALGVCLASVYRCLGDWISQGLVSHTHHREAGRATLLYAFVQPKTEEPTP